MGIADGELVHDGAGLVGINDDHFAGGQGAGEDPHPAGGGIGLGELLCLSEHGGQGRRPSVGGVLESLGPSLALHAYPPRSQEGEHSELYFASRSPAHAVSRTQKTVGSEPLSHGPQIKLGHKMTFELQV